MISVEEEVDDTWADDITVESLLSRVQPMLGRISALFIYATQCDEETQQGIAAGMAAMMQMDFMMMPPNAKVDWEKYEPAVFVEEVEENKSPDFVEPLAQSSPCPGQPQPISLSSSSVSEPHSAFDETGSVRETQTSIDDSERRQVPAWVEIARSPLVVAFLGRVLNMSKNLDYTGSTMPNTNGECKIIIHKANDSCRRLIKRLRKTQRLTKLRIETQRFKPGIGAFGMQAIASLLISNSSLCTIDLSYTFDRQNSQGVGKALRNMLEMPSNLMELYLQGNHMGDLVIYELVLGLCKSRSLRVLNLCDNKIGVLGAEYLGAALVQNNILSDLILGRDDIGPDGISALASALKVNRSLMRFKVYDVFGGSQGEKDLADALIENEGLIELQFGNVSFEGLEHLRSVLQHNTTLQVLLLNGQEACPVEDYVNACFTSITAFVSSSLRKFAICFAGLPGALLGEIKTAVEATPHILCHKVLAEKAVDVKLKAIMEHGFEANESVHRFTITLTSILAPTEKHAVIDSSAVEEMFAPEASYSNAFVSDILLCKRVTDNADTPCIVRCSSVPAQLCQRHRIADNPLVQLDPTSIPVFVRSTSLPNLALLHDKPSPRDCPSVVTSYESSFPTTESSSVEVRPMKKISLRALLPSIVNNRLPSTGTIAHPSCIVCVPFLRGSCPRGETCHRCHATHTWNDVQRGRGATRQRAARRKAAILRIRTPSP